MDYVSDNHSTIAAVTAITQSTSVKSAANPTGMTNAVANLYR
jgi:hypothetical protein